MKSSVFFYCQNYIAIAVKSNINKVLTKIGIGSVANMSYGDKVIIEPLFDICLAGEYQALTVTEIAYCGRSVKGGSSNGGTSNGTSSTWGLEVRI